MSVVGRAIHMRLSRDILHADVNEDDSSSRLHDEASRRLMQQQWIEKAIDQARRNQYSFRPSINPITDAIVGSGHPDYKPIYKRVADVQRTKTQNFMKLVADRYDEDKEKNTFAPKIDEKSRQIADKRAESFDVASR